MVKRMPIPFSSLRAAILDMDGVLWRGSTALPGVAALLNFSRHKTSVSRWQPTTAPRRGYVCEPLNALRARPAAARDHVGGCHCRLCAEPLPTTTPFICGAGWYPSGSFGLGYREIRRCRTGRRGIDFEVTYEKLKIATLRIRAGAICGNERDRTFLHRRDWFRQRQPAGAAAARPM